METYAWLIAALSIGVGCWVQTSMGFGMAVVAAPIIILIEPRWVPYVITAIALVLSILNAIDQWKDIEIHQLKLAFITRIPGTIFGLWLLTVMSIFYLQLFIASAVLLAVVISYYGKQFEYTRRRLGIAAFVSGLTGTTTSIGGPPMALVMQHGNAKNIRANLSIYFVYSCTLSLIGYAYIGALESDTLKTIASFAPFAVLGFLVGKKTHGYVDAGRFRPFLLLVCGIAGLFSIYSVLSNYQG